MSGAVRRPRYSEDTAMQVCGDRRLVGVGDGTAIIMTGQEIAAGLTPALLLAAEERRLAALARTQPARLPWRVRLRILFGCATVHEIEAGLPSKALAALR